MVEGSHRRIVPPIYFFGALAVLLLFGFALPPVTVVSPRVDAVTGYVLILCAAAIWLSCLRSFRQAGTPLHPFEKSTALVTSGAYRYSRNPIYAAMCLFLFGASLSLNFIPGALIIPLYARLISRSFIEGEEANLEATFGTPYLDYKTRVRRWI